MKSSTMPEFVAFASKSSEIARCIGRVSNSQQVKVSARWALELSSCYSFTAPVGPRAECVGCDLSQRYGADTNACV
jgi:hypothetical protein